MSRIASQVLFVPGLSPTDEVLEILLAEDNPETTNENITLGMEEVANQ